MNNLFFKYSVRSSTFIFLVLVCFVNKASSRDNKPDKFPDRIILNLQEDASSSIAVTWRTEKSISESYCEVQKLGKAPVNQENSKSFKANLTSVNYGYEGEETIEAVQHSVIITGLTEGEKYVYRVGTEGFWSEWLELRLPEKSGAFSFLYFGDPQNDLKSRWSGLVRKAYNVVPGCSFMLYGGDIINKAGRDVEWGEWFHAGSFIFATVPQVLTPGNHDYNGLDIDPHWNFQFTQPKNGPASVRGTCFFSDYKNLKIISIDSATESELEDENGKALLHQKSWLDSVLTVNTKDWVILTTHLPFYSSKESRDNPQLRKHFQPILEKHGVDLVLTGHDHSYARGVASDNPEIKPSIVYVVSVSGPKQYEAGGKEWMKKSGSQMQLFQEITIDNYKLVFTAYTADGAVFDKFTIKKNKKGKNRTIEWK